MKSSGMFSVFNFVFAPNLAGSDLELASVLVLDGKKQLWLAGEDAGRWSSFVFHFPHIFCLYPEKQLKMVDTL